ncbi:MBL fold metallo-hydrolase, partial [Agrococcus casei]
MRIVKRGHACLEVTESGKTLIIDPGDHTEPLDPSDLVAVVITHEHPDHWDAAHLRAIRERFPEAPIFGPPGVLEAA